MFDVLPVAQRAAVAALCALCTLAGATRDAAAQSPPFARTEQREPCTSYDPLRQPFFGETHLHTQYSIDAATLDTRNTPRDAYVFAKGGKVGLPPFVDTRTGDEPDVPPPAIGPVSSHPYCLPPARCEFTATRTIQFPPGRQLDFAAVTDHAEQFGETNICFWEESAPCQSDADCPSAQECSQGTCRPEGYDSDSCVLAREEVTRLRSGIAPVLFAAAYNLAETPTRLPFCDENSPLLRTGSCVEQARNVWEQIQIDAEEAYDRTSACSFTSFIAYEYTPLPGYGQCSNSTRPCWDQIGTGVPSVDCPLSGVPGRGPNGTCDSVTGGANLHRNVIFRNHDVIDVPISNVEAPPNCGVGKDCLSPANGGAPAPGAIAAPTLLLSQLKAQCIDNPAKPDCDVLSIPHNSNLSGGAMFLVPETIGEARIRGEMEPLVELFQIKGSSECRYSPEGTWGTVDEDCDFENMSFARLNGDFYPTLDATNLPATSFVRNALKAGIAYADEHGGVNPFRLGFVGGLDNHNGTPGASDEAEYAKTGGHGDQSFAVSGQILNEVNFLGMQTNSGGLTVVWAEENSRDSIFAAMKRRETYATSGSRPIVRFFGGKGLPADLCSRGDFVAAGYANGVPMGGTLAGAASDPAPSFAVLAMMDGGGDVRPNVPLQSVQIIKGWVDAEGETHEQVHQVAGTPGAGSVDLKTCTPIGPGHPTLCAVWSDPDFDPGERAFYYARVLENPSCRWNQFYCNARGVDCSQPNLAPNGTDRYTEFEYEQCCSGVVPSTIQERAWTSPIWYAPAAGS